MDKWLQNNIVLRVISVVIAITLWFSVSHTTFPSLESQAYQADIPSVPVEADYDHEQFALVKMSAATATLTLTGDADTLQRLPSTYRLYVDLNKLGTGFHHHVPIQVAGIPVGVKTTVSPATVDVQLEEKVQRQVSVNAMLVGKLAAGYQMGTPQIDPTHVLVRGNESQIDQVESVKAVIDLNNVTKSIHRFMKVQAYSNQGPMSQIVISPDMVNVDMAVISPSKQLPPSISISKFPPSGYAVEQVQPSVNTVTVYGPQSVLDSLTSYTVPPLDLSTVTADQTFSVTLPVDTKLIKVDPQTITMYVKIVPADTKTINGIPLQIRGASSGEQVTSTTSSLDVILSGAMDLLSSLGIKDIQAYVDVSNLPVGQHELPIQFVLPPYIQVVGQDSFKAIVQINPK